jgi:hypothetical protein
MVTGKKFSSPSNPLDEVHDIADGGEHGSPNCGM